MSPFWTSLQQVLISHENKHTNTHTHRHTRTHRQEVKAAKWTQNCTEVFWSDQATEAEVSFTLGNLKQYQAAAAPGASLYRWHSEDSSKPNREASLTEGKKERSKRRMRRLRGEEMWLNPWCWTVGDGGDRLAQT